MAQAKSFPVGLIAREPRRKRSKDRWFVSSLLSSRPPVSLPREGTQQQGNVTRVRPFIRDFVPIPPREGSVEMTTNIPEKARQRPIAILWITIDSCYGTDRTLPGYNRVPATSYTGGRLLISREETISGRGPS